MAYEAYKTEKWLISIRNANWLAISYWNKFNFTVEQINKMLKNYYWDNPVRYLQAKYEEKLAKEDAINSDF